MKRVNVQESVYEESFIRNALLASRVFWVKPAAAIRDRQLDYQAAYIEPKLRCLRVLQILALMKN